jgi:hypothetical protein
MDVTRPCAKEVQVLKLDICGQASSPVDEALPQELLSGK